MSSKKSVLCLVLNFLFAFNVFAGRDARQTEADLSNEFKQVLSSGFSYQNATLLFHQLNLVGETNPQDKIQNLIEEGEGLVQNAKKLKRNQSIEFKFSSLLARALGLASGAKATVAYRMRVGDMRERIQETLKTLTQMNEMFFQSGIGGIGNPVRSPDSELNQKINWMLFQWRLFATLNRLCK